MNHFQEYERKVHFHHDNEGATMPSHIPGVGGKPFANTLCKMNSRDPLIQLTTDPKLVTCLKRMGHSAAPVQEIIRVVRVLEYVGERSAVERVLQQNAVKGFAE